MTVFTLASRDGIFAKDGRGWYTSASGRANGVSWPFPSTLLGALRTAWGREQETALGRAFTQSEWEQAKQVMLTNVVVLRIPLNGGRAIVSHRVWPVPLDTLFMPVDSSGGKRAALIRLDPVPPVFSTLGSDEDTAREALWRPEVLDPRKPDSRPHWWSEAAFIEWLAGDGDRERGDVRWEGCRPPRRPQIHVGIDPDTLAAKDGLLFGYEVTETLDITDKDQREWLIACEVTGWINSSGEGRFAATLGGDRRSAVLEYADQTLFNFPSELGAAFEKHNPTGLRLVVVTPMASKSGWLPEELREDGGIYFGRLPGVDAEVQLNAAFVGRPLHVSGWDMAARRPKETTRLVPPGSVYHFRKRNGAGFTHNEAQQLWLKALGSRADEGFGRVVPGIWRPKEN